MKKNLLKKTACALLAASIYFIGSTGSVAQNPPAGKPVPSSPYPAGLPAPVQPVPPQGLKTDTMSIPRPVKPMPDTLNNRPRRVIPSSDTAPVPKRKN